MGGPPGVVGHMNKELRFCVSSPLSINHWGFFLAILTDRQLLIISNTSFMAPSATLPHSEAANNMATVNMVEAAQELIDPEVLPKLDPVFVKYFVEVLAPRPPTHKVPIREIRQNPQKYGWPWAIDTTGWPRVIDRELSSEDGSFFPVKIYYPDPIKHGDGPYPVHLNYHGISSAPPCVKLEVDN